MAKYGMIIDLDKCIGCLACVAACKEEYDIPTGLGQQRVRCLEGVRQGRKTEPNLTEPGIGRNWVYCVEDADQEGKPGLSFYPGLCNHCDINPCIDACPSGATYKDDDGIVLIDPELCIGCGYCVPACPYGARYVNQKKGIADKCTFCRSRIDVGKQPACVITCLAKCRYFGDLQDQSSQVGKIVGSENPPGIESAETALKPNVKYLGKVHRERIKAAGVPGLAHLSPSGKLWTQLLDPMAKVALISGVAGVVGGVALNRLAERKSKVQTQKEKIHE